MSQDLQNPSQRSPGSTQGSQVTPERNQLGSQDHVHPRKKVAKVKPNPRNVENVILTGDSEVREQSPVSVDVATTSATSHQSISTDRRPRTKISSNPPTPIDTGGATTTECIQLIRQIWNLRDEMVEFHRKILRILNLSRSRVKYFQNQSAKKSKVNPLPKIPSPLDLTPLEPWTSDKGSNSSSLISLLGINWNLNSNLPSFPAFIFSLQTLTENFIQIESQFNSLSPSTAQFKLVLYTKILHARKYLTHDHLSILYSIYQLIVTVIHLLASCTSVSDDILQENVTGVCQLTESYNVSLRSVFQRTYESGSKGTKTGSADRKEEAELSKVRILQELNTVMENDAPWIALSLKPISATKILNIYLQKRILPASHAFSDVLHTNFVQKLGNVSENENRLTEVTAELNLDQFFTTFVEEEEVYMRTMIEGISESSHLLGQGAIGEERMRKRAVRRLYTYLQERLWAGVGETAKELLLWGSKNPLVLVPFATLTQLRNMLSMALQKIGAKGSALLSAVTCVCSSLHSFTLLSNWDHKLRTCFEAAMKFKRPEQTELQQNLGPAQWATPISEHYAHILTTTLLLMDGEDEVVPTHSRPNLDQSQAMNLKFGAEGDEELLLDEAQVLFRLDATFFYFVAWVTKRSKAWLNSWAIPHFLAVSQRDTKLLWQLLNSRQSILITREILLRVDNISVRLAAQQRQFCADDLRNTLNLLHGLPKEVLEDVGPICLTLSLATLQSCMPGPKHWTGVGPGCGLDPDKPSTYVATFISRVIEPVTLAAVNFVSPAVQEAMGKEVIEAASEAWLQHILQKKLKFSEWGAIQLLRDFVSLRQWIRNQTNLAPEARKAILDLEILKRCQGVAYLLLRSPGDILGVGKSIERSRRRSSSPQPPDQPEVSGSGGSSPSLSATMSVTQDDIPPEMYVSNQQMWLELRLRPGRLSFPSCC